MKNPFDNVNIMLQMLRELYTEKSTLIYKHLALVGQNSYFWQWLQCKE